MSQEPGVRMRTPAAQILPPATQSAGDQNAVQIPAPPAPAAKADTSNGPFSPTPDYPGNLPKRVAISGDWEGWRTSLAREREALRDKSLFLLQRAGQLFISDSDPAMKRDSGDYCFCL